MTLEGKRFESRFLEPLDQRSGPFTGIGAVASRSIHGHLARWGDRPGIDGYRCGERLSPLRTLLDSTTATATPPRPADSSTLLICAGSQREGPGESNPPGLLDNRAGSAPDLPIPRLPASGAEPRRPREPESTRSTRRSTASPTGPNTIRPWSSAATSPSG